MINSCPLFYLKLFKLASVKLDGCGQGIDLANVPGFTLQTGRFPEGVA
ncbi:hypothetical protein HMPREF9372_0988 [Sporosarcina newyorkensis 2681]|uniref:Uncharacterized protein n=1 Tax=Sporosarcina newyorkensis 2681 TaxID=1027292 RepID=F9DQA8_9BACL|nr:hypothetical protein HMPREF9372_0988 [Sporosarcina newyorkensis 2681]